MVALAGTDVWAVGARTTYSSAQTLVEHWNGTAWAVVPSPNGGTYDNTLTGVAAVAANDVWAVGYYAGDTTGETLVEHWNGTAWAIVPSPNVGTGANELAGVAARAGNDVWAVGDYTDPNTGDNQTLVEHWNGTVWAVVASPNAGVDGGNILSGVAAVAGNDVWAVGSYIDPATTYKQTLVEHWDGSTWSVVPSPNAGISDNWLTGMAAVAGTDVWAVGAATSSTSSAQALLEHWNGTAWAVVPSPNGGAGGHQLTAVAARAGNDVWAVGKLEQLSARQTLVEHWNGTAWAVVPSPNPGTQDNTLTGVAAVAGNDVWAVGGFAASSGSSNGQTLVEHWDGGSWAVVPSPNVGTTGNTLSGVAARAGNDVWAVGYVASSSGSLTLVEHWDGTAWAVVPSPDLDMYENRLTGVVALAADDVWAVGWYWNDPDTTYHRTLVEHWDGSTWAVVPSPNVGIGDNQLTGVAARAGNDVWAVGYATSSTSNKQTLAEHWNVHRLGGRAQPQCRDRSQWLTGMAAVAGNDVWAVGYLPLPRQARRRWWNTGTAPPGRSCPARMPAAPAVRSPGWRRGPATSVWAVGVANSSTSNKQTLVEHWDGTAWSVVPSPNPGTRDNTLIGVAAVAGNDVWAAGTDAYSSTGTGYQTLVEHYGTGSCAPATPSPVPTATRPPGGTATASPTPCTAGVFSDVHPTDYFATPVQYLASHGSISGYADCTFRPYNNTTRAQMVKIPSCSASPGQSSRRSREATASPMCRLAHRSSRSSRRRRAARSPRATAAAGRARPVTRSTGCTPGRTRT